MLNKIVLSLLIVPLLSLRLSGQEMSHADSLNTVLDAYYELNIQIFQAGSTLADIDSVFALFTEDFTYVHPKYGGTYSREDLYNGYVRNQQAGRYDGGVVDIKVVDKMVGLNAIAVVKQFISKDENGRLKAGDDEMAVFEFEDGKIKRITEYW